MTKEREQAELETMLAIESIHRSGDETFLRAAALSYAKGLRDAAEILSLRNAGNGTHAQTAGLGA